MEPPRSARRPTLSESGRSIETLLAQGGHYVDPATGTIVPPIHPSTTYARDERYELIGYGYSRSGNPTCTQVEDMLARLEGAEDALVFASGLAGVATFFDTVPGGGHVVAPRVMYHGAADWLRRLAGCRGIGVTFFDAAPGGPAPPEASARPRAAVHPAFRAGDLARRRGEPDRVSRDGGGAGQRGAGEPAPSIGRHRKRGRAHRGPGAGAGPALRVGRVGGRNEDTVHLSPRPFGPCTARRRAGLSTYGHISLRPAPPSGWRTDHHALPTLRWTPVDVRFACGVRSRLTAGIGPEPPPGNAS